MKRTTVNKLTISFFSSASDFIESLPDIDKAKVLAAIKTMETSFDGLYIKPLRGPIKELIVRKYRIIFFLKKNIIYIVTGFTKKSQKTPQKEIENAENIYKQIN